MLDIAEKAGVAKATLYEYFSSKEALFEELLHTKVIRPYFSFAERVDASASCETQIRQFIEMEMEFLLNLMEERNILPTIFIDNELISNAATAAQTIMRFKFRFICDLIEKGMKRGEFRASDPVIATACVIGAFNSYTACFCKARAGCFPISLPERAEADEMFFSNVFHGLK
jgi:AcrR family transcriptional regulator